MISPEGLNPKEVLAHLNALGYQNISPHQLKDFIHDLKKLIKYEQKQNFVEFQKPKPNCCHYDCSCTEISDKFSSTECSQICNTSQGSSSATYRRDLDFKVDEMPKNNVKSSKDNIRPSSNKPKNNAVVNDFSNKKKIIRDPVKLYHQYKEYWKRLGVPGERKHSDLRWMIRCKMLGQESHPK